MRQKGGGRGGRSRGWFGAGPRFAASLPRLFLSALVALGLASMASAEGPSSEAQALIDLRSGRLPLAVSRDGQWLVHVDGHSVLHRTGAADLRPDRKLEMPTAIRELSASRSARVVAFVDETGCVGTVDFAAKVPVIRRLVRWCADSPAATEPGRPRSGLGHSDSTAVAISADGKTLAALTLGRDGDGAPTGIALIDVASQRVLKKLPALRGDAEDHYSNILHLRFVDDDSKLFVVQALKGTRWEGPGTTSDLQFAVWDLKSRTLFSFFRTGAGELASDDFLWSLAEPTGELRTLRPQNDYWEARRQKTPVPLVGYNHRQCGSLVATRLPRSGLDFIEFAIDPLGRWLATVEAPLWEHDEARKPVLTVRDASGGKVLKTLRLDSPLRALTPSADGKALFGVLAGKAEKAEQSLAANEYRGGGKLMRIALPESIAGIAAQDAGAWPAAGCRIEDETSNARQVGRPKGTASRLYSLDLTPLNEEKHGVRACHGALSGRDYVYDGNGDPDRWGIADDGSVWIDRITRLEQIDPPTGKRLRDIATPRGKDTCSVAHYAAKRFINWQGDTVTSRSFADAGVGRDRRILAHKPGWQATQIGLQGTYLGILWKKDDVQSRVAFHELASGKRLQEVAWGMEMSDPDDVFELFLERPKPAAGEIRWEVSYLGSVRARVRRQDDSGSETVLWDGLAEDSGDAGWQQQGALIHRVHGVRLIDLGAGKAAFLRPGGRLVLYDAGQRQRLAEIATDGEPIDARWVEAQRLLFVETAPYWSDRQGYRWQLHAYRIE